MFSAPLSKKFRSFAFYLGMGYLTVYALGSCIIFLLSSRVITKSARSFDRQDVRAHTNEPNSDSDERPKIKADDLARA